MEPKADLFLSLLASFFILTVYLFFLFCFYRNKSFFFLLAFQTGREINSYCSVIVRITILALPSCFSTFLIILMFLFIAILQILHICTYDYTYVPLFYPKTKVTTKTILITCLNLGPLYHFIYFCVQNSIVVTEP